MSDQVQLPTVVERSAVQAGAQPQALVPTSLSGVWKLSEIIAESGMAPRDMKSPQQISVAIMHGMEVGMTPMTALQSIAVVNGRPTIWGDGAIGLIRASGLLASFKEWTDGTGDKMTAYCEVKRKGEDDVGRGEFSVEDAKTAGLWKKAGPWTQYPKRMLQMRARAFALRDKFADVLRGLAIREEMEDVERSGGGAVSMEPPPAPTQTAVPKRQRKHEVIENAEFIEVAATPPAAPRAEAPKAVPPQPEGASASQPLPEVQSDFDAEEFLATLKEQLSTVQTPNDIEDIRALFAEEMDMLTRSERETAEFLIEEAESALTSTKPAGKPAEQDKPAASEDDDLSPPSAPTSKPAAPEVDPFEVPANFADVEAYRQWVLVMVQSASTPEHGSAIKAAWKATIPVRNKLNMSTTTIDELKKLAQDTINKVGLAEG